MTQEKKWTLHSLSNFWTPGHNFKWFFWVPQWVNNFMSRRDGSYIHSDTYHGCYFMDGFGNLELMAALGEVFVFVFFAALAVLVLGFDAFVVWPTIPHNTFTGQLQIATQKDDCCKGTGLLLKYPALTVFTFVKHFMGEIFLLGLFYWTMPYGIAITKGMTIFLNTIVSMVSFFIFVVVMHEKFPTKCDSGFVCKNFWYFILMALLSTLSASVQVWNKSFPLISASSGMFELYGGLLVYALFGGVIIEFFTSCCICCLKNCDENNRNYV